MYNFFSKEIFEGVLKTGAGYFSYAFAPFGLSLRSMLSNILFYNSLVKLI